MQTKKDTVRKKILKTAGTIFSDSGFDKATMRAVASGAGITPGNLYTYFKSKEEIFLTLLIDMQEKRLRQIYSDMEKGNNGLERLYLYGDSYFKYTEKHPEELRLALNWEFNGMDTSKISAEVAGEYSSRKRPLQDKFISVFEEGIEDKSIREDLNIQLTISYFTMTLRLMLNEVLILKYRDRDFFYNYLEFILKAVAKQKGK